jgi:hypothetical protein
MDKLLRDIQVELLPGREPEPPISEEPLLSDPPPVSEPEPAAVATAAPEPAPAPPPAAPTASPPAPAPDLQALSELAARLLASMRELLAGYERVLVRPVSPQSPARRTTRRPADSPDVTLSAAPFPSLEALHEFEQAVSRLPGVREVAVRGYEGTDRAIIEVRLQRAGSELRPGGRNP